ncbi:hypothetical protein J2X65_000794 [Ancylobacter sp. 3268]|uniref:hypothetical protein n=1 Tax=Ancylobacter sp. 3268 TaxID=2817752 RepID=UPI00285F71D8|nr:hypothetical protein [Ancylobacter sp. 3268]MDR6951446.1 hypothetical protein [Ancylobacter sp. 3268]
MSLVHNERTKLTATLLNNVAAAMLITGGGGLIVALSYGPPGLTGGWSALGITAIWISSGAAIHYMARLLLKGSKP